MQQKLINNLLQDFPKLQFVAGGDFSWSPTNNQITYDSTNKTKEQIKLWSLLHEVGHALLDHQKYQSDVELLILEVAAWQKAKQLAPKYKISINSEHIQNYLDTYRDWLYKRSSCPKCTNQSLQQSTQLYSCFNCQTKWKVTNSRFCRPYRSRIDN